MRTTNKKANRTFDALAHALNYLPDKTIYKINGIINDQRDGYRFDFIAAVNNYRRLCSSNKISIVPFID